MLKSTFQHIPGVGQKSEKRLWMRGARSWDDILKSDCGLSRDVHRRLKAGVLESISRLEELDNDYFRRCLPGRLTWRAYREFRDHTCFLDIETTGLFPASAHVTTVCLHSAHGTKTYIHGKNLQDLGGDLEKHRLLVTFNGSRFDLPFLGNSMGLKFNQIHLDLMQPLRSLGYRGGLKAIEKQLGISRGSEGVSGLDAVYLWHAYRSGRPVTVAGKRVAGEDALRALVEYNRDDTVNLERLADLTVSMLREKTLGDMEYTAL